MNRRLQTLIFLVVAAVAGAAGYYFNRVTQTAPATDAGVRKLLQAPLTGLDGERQTLSQWRGKILVVNFWATWCQPCREEIPGLIKVRRRYLANGVEFVGIAIDDVAKVRDFAKEFGMDYSLLIAGAETLAISREVGNPAGVLPFTVVLDRNERVAYAQAGALTEARLEAVLTPLL